MKRLLILVSTLGCLGIGACSGGEPTREAQVGIELWHCGIRPVAFDGRQWRAESTIDAPNPPAGFGGTGTMQRATADSAVYTDGASGEVIRFAPLEGEYDPPICG